MEKLQQEPHLFAREADLADGADALFQEAARVLYQDASEYVRDDVKLDAEGNLEHLLVKYVNRLLDETALRQLEEGDAVALREQLREFREVMRALPPPCVSMGACICAVEDDF